MDWDRIRTQWREATPSANLLSLHELRTRDGALWKTVRRRDLLETIAGVFVAIFFGAMTIVALSRGEWLQGGFALLVAGWGAELPFRMHRHRRLALEPGHGLDLRAFLERQRDAALVQARLLERVWLWYLAPPAIGLAGLTLARDGLTAGALRFIGVMLVLCVVLVWANRYAARTQFRAHADALERQLDALAGDS